jgi:DNA integrity scanning protein DisA with diadenylate cyclase activity
MLAFALVELKLALAQYHFKHLAALEGRQTQAIKTFMKIKKQTDRVYIAQVERLQNLVSLCALAVDDVSKNVADLQHLVEIAFDA